VPWKKDIGDSGERQGGRPRQQPQSDLVRFLANTGFSELDLERRTDLNRDIEL